MKRESIASALIGGISVFALFVAFTDHGPRSPHATLFVLSFCCDGLCLAFAPEVLFEKVTLWSLFKGEGAVQRGIAALFAMFATLFFIGAVVFLGLSYASL